MYALSLALSKTVTRLLSDTVNSFLSSSNDLKPGSHMIVVVVQQLHDSYATIWEQLCFLVVQPSWASQLLHDRVRCRNESEFYFCNPVHRHRTTSWKWERSRNCCATKFTQESVHPSRFQYPGHPCDSLRFLAAFVLNEQQHKVDYLYLLWNRVNRPRHVI